MKNRKESMKNYSIAVIPGDGIGQDVVLEGIKVLKAAGYRFNVTFNLSDFHWGSDYYIREGLMMPKDGLAILKPFDAIYFGAVGHPEIPDDVTLHGLLLPIRRSFDQYVCLRPNVLYKGIQSPLSNLVRAIDLVVVRENTEGEYTDVGEVFTISPQKKLVYKPPFLPEEARNELFVTLLSLQENVKINTR